MSTVSSTQHESERIKRLLGDPPFRADAYRDDVTRAKQLAATPALRTLERQVLILWDAGVPVGDIAARAEVDEMEVIAIVSKAVGE